MTVLLYFAILEKQLEMPTGGIGLEMLLGPVQDDLEQREQRQSAVFPDDELHREVEHH